MGRRKREKLLGRWKLPEALTHELEDFCDAHRGAPEHRIIADAIRAFIEDRLKAEPELKQRFDEARRRRLGILEGSNVTVLPTAK
jgi:hypothetical protein